MLNLQVEDLCLLFAKKASEFNSWFENAEEDLTDPVRCNSVDQIRVSVLCILINPFVPNSPFFDPLKTSENLTVF